MTPAEQLTRALVDLATQGRRPRCGDPVTRDCWTSEDKRERQLAAGWCTGCPVLLQCRAAAEEMGETFGVWGGLDVGKGGRTPRAAPDQASRDFQEPGRERHDDTAARAPDASIDGGERATPFAARTHQRPSQGGGGSEHHRAPAAAVHPTSKQHPTITKGQAMTDQQHDPEQDSRAFARGLFDANQAESTEPEQPEAKAEPESHVEGNHVSGEGANPAAAGSQDWLDRQTIRELFNH